MSVISVENLHYAYPPLLPDEEPIAVLRGIDLTVERGEFLSLMGPTGGGKTTLCMALNGLVPQSTGGVIRGRVEVLGYDTRRTPVAELAAHVGIVYQDPESQLFCTKVEDEVAFGPENLALDPREIAERVAWALDVVSMSAYRDRSPTQLSGGQKQRVAIAASLAMLPEVLILDEPTASLDPVGQAEVFGVIERLCRERRMTIVMVSHDAEHVAQFSDRVAVLWEGRIARLDTPRRIFEDAELLAQTGLCAPQVAEAALALNRRYGTRYHFIRLDEAIETLQGQRASPPNEASRAVSDGTGHAHPSTTSATSSSQRDAASRPAIPRLGDTAAPPCIRVEQLVYTYDAWIPALNGVDLEIAEGAYVGIVGQNGSGKTTLVKHLNGLLQPTAGRVWIYGRETTQATVSELARSVGYVFQNPDHQIFCATTREEIRFGPRNLGLDAAEVEARTEDALRAFGLEPYAALPPAVLGYGLRRKVSVAAVYAMRPRILILDEPTTGLDWRSAGELMALIAALHAQGHTILLITHDMRLVAEYIPETLVMHEGRVLAYGPTPEVLARREALAQAQLVAPQITRLGWALLEDKPALLTVPQFCAAYPHLQREGR